MLFPHRELSDKWLANFAMSQRLQSPFAFDHQLIHQLESWVRAHILRPAKSIGCVLKQRDLVGFPGCAIV
jgi:hypothetical protein